MFRKTFWAVLAGLISVAAGLYLLSTQTVSSSSIFDPLLHGLGAYLIARGVFMWWTAMRTCDELELLEQLVHVQTAELQRHHQVAAAERDAP